ncbi:MAG: ABC transporter ATP-binding protein [Candidatus Dependentiae bacterium]
MNNMLLRADDIKKIFRTHQGTLDVLCGVNYTFRSGHSYAITGASGTGKSTLLHILAGLTEPTQGTIFINEQNIALFDVFAREQFLNSTIGLLFQMPYLIKELTVLENVMTKGLIAGQEVEQCKKEALLLLEKMGLPDKAYEKPPVLSGGQQQRVALARALFAKPSFLLADEPTGNLDTKTGRVIMDLLLESQKAWGMGIIISTHDQSVAQRVEQQLKLESGELKKV